MPMTVFFDASLHLETVHRKVQQFDDSNQERDLQAVDMFAGDGNFTTECRKVGLTCDAVGIRISDSHDILTQQGFWFVLGLILRVVAWTTILVSQFRSTNYGATARV